MLCILASAHACACTTIIKHNEKSRFRLLAQQYRASLVNTQTISWTGNLLRSEPSDKIKNLLSPILNKYDVNHRCEPISTWFRILMSNKGQVGKEQVQSICNKGRLQSHDLLNRLFITQAYKLIG